MAAPCSKSIRGVSACRLRNIRVRGVKKMTKLVWEAAAAALVAATPAPGAAASQPPFGKLPDGPRVPGRSTERGVGKEWVSRFNSRWSLDHNNQKETDKN